jgi:hypothetical protein
MGPVLAQLVEHLTVVVKELSKCRWFDSGKPEILINIII